MSASRSSDSSHSGQASAGGPTASRNHGDEVGALVRRLEADLDLFRHELDGWSVWPLFRLDAAYLFKTPTVASLFAHKPAIDRGRQFGMALGDLWRLVAAPGRGRPVVVSSSSYRIERDEEGRPKDWLFDDLCRSLGACNKIEQVDLWDLFKLHSASAVPSRFTNSIPNLLGEVLITRLPVPQDIDAVARALAEDLHTQPEWRRLFPLGVIRRRLARFRRKRRAWTLILRHLSPPFLFLDDSCFNHSIIAAAKDCGIKVLELQHGTFFDEGPEYGWPDEAAKYRDRMPVPDRLLLFGRSAVEILHRDLFWGDRARAVGNPRIDQYRGLRRRRRVEGPSDQALLVIASQGFAQADMIRWITDLLACARDWAGFRIVLKLHPAADYPKDTYLAGLPSDDRLSVLLGDEDPTTFDLLSQADFHASIFSSCHFDAVSLGVPTFVLPFTNHEFMRPMVDAGHAWSVATPSEMVRKMRDFCSRPQEIDVGDQYYRPNAVPNILHEIDALMRSDMIDEK